LPGPFAGDDITRQAIEAIRGGRGRKSPRIETLTKGGTRGCRDYDLLEPGDSVDATLTFSSDKDSRHWEPGPPCLRSSRGPARSEEARAPHLGVYATRGRPCTEPRTHQSIGLVCGPLPPRPLEERRQGRRGQLATVLRGGEDAFPKTGQAVFNRVTNWRSD
jgi:hypothetical protein